MCGVDDGIKWAWGAVGVEPSGVLLIEIWVLVRGYVGCNAIGVDPFLVGVCVFCVYEVWVLVRGCTRRFRDRG